MPLYDTDIDYLRRLLRHTRFCFDATDLCYDIDDAIIFAITC